MRTNDLCLDIVTKVKALDLPSGQYVIVGGGSLAVRGIRDTKDLDIVVTSDVFKYLSQDWQVDSEFEQKWRRQRLTKDKVEIYQDLYFEKGNVSQKVENLLPHTDLIEGIAFQNLAHLIMCKLETAREKDLQDVELIYTYLKSN